MPLRLDEILRLLAPIEPKRMEWQDVDRPLLDGRQPGDRVYLIGSSLAKTYRRRKTGVDLVLNLLSPGQVAGLEMMGGGDLLASAMLAPGCVYELSLESLQSVCRSTPELSEWLARDATGRLGEMARRMEGWISLSLGQRLLLALHELAPLFPSTGGGTGASRIPLSQHQLAGIAGATREPTSQKLNQLARTGLISLERGAVIVPSLAALLVSAGDDGRSHGAA